MTGFDAAVLRGRLKAAREILLMVWEVKFGRIPKTLGDAVGATDDRERLERALQRLACLDHPDESILDHDT